MPEPWQILGLRLRPFSLGHYKLLRRFGCAFVSETSEPATRGDLLLGVLICSMPVGEFAAMVDDAKPLRGSARLKEWLRCLWYKQPLPANDFEAALRAWGRKVGIFNLNNRAQMFKDYIEQQSTVPKYWEERSGGSSGAHWAQCLEVTLRSKLGWTQTDIDTQPLCKAFADYFKHAENEGAIKLMTPDEITFIESQKEAAHGA